MRCFLAIDINKKAKEEIIRIQKEIEREVESSGLKFVEQENLHLTLNFFGELNDFQINKIKKALKEFHLEKIECYLGTIGFFPSSEYIRVVWIALEPSEKIKEINEKMGELLKKEGFKKEDKFESHITLARVKFLKDKKEFLKKIKDLKVQPITFKIDSISLKKSTLTSQGPIYEDIFRI